MSSSDLTSVSGALGAGAETPPFDTSTTPDDSRHVRGRADVRAPTPSERQQLVPNSAPPAQANAADFAGLSSGHDREGSFIDRTREEPDALGPSESKDVELSVDERACPDNGQIGEIADQTLAAIEVLEEDRFPEPRPEPTWDPAGPLGPDPESVRALSEALDREMVSRRSHRRNEEDADGVEGGPAGGGGAAEVRHTSLLQNSAAHSRCLVRGRQLLERYKRENCGKLADEDVDPGAFTEWLLSLRPFLSTSSWRVYRCSAVAVIQTIPHPGLNEAIAVLLGDGRRAADSARAVDRRTREKEDVKTSATRAKRLDYLHYSKICSELRNLSRAAAVDWLEDWLVAGISTGVLPSEWPRAHLEVRLLGDRRKIWLHVVNCVHTTELVSGTYRTLDISDYRPKTLQAIERMVKRAHQWAMEGKTSQRRSDCTQLFYQVCDTLFPRMQVKYSLFSLRHQFIANMKSVLSAAEVSALIGGIAAESSPEHYVKRRSAWDKFYILDIPVPIEQQVKRVQRRMTRFEEREHLLQLRRDFIAARDLRKDRVINHDRRGPGSGSRSGRPL